jgi:hypothetical protein
LFGTDLIFEKENITIVIVIVININILFTSLIFIVIRIYCFWIM